MNYAIVTDIIKKQIIRSFAMLDAWFDKDLLIRPFNPTGLFGKVTCRLGDVIHTNDFLLTEINKAITDPGRKLNSRVTDYTGELDRVTKAAESFVMLSGSTRQHGSMDLPAVREQLRDQLYDCLIQLDALSNDAGLLYQTSFKVNNSEPFSVYQVMYFMAMVIQKEVCDLGQLVTHIEETPIPARSIKEKSEEHQSLGPAE